MDESAYVDENLFFRVIAPVLNVRNTVLLAITTLMEAKENNWFTRLIGYKDDSGKSLVHSTKFAKICDKCAKLPQEKAIECNHVKNANPFYMNNDVSDKWKDVNKLEGKENITMTEYCGLPGNVDGKAFLDSTIESFVSEKNRYKNQEVYISPKIVPRIFVMMDPNGGGLNNAAVCIGYKNMRDGKVIVSMTKVIYLFIIFIIIIGATFNNSCYV